MSQQNSLNLFLTPDIIDWLLEPDNPPVRFFTLTDLMDRPDDDPQVIRCKKLVMTQGLIPGILSRQNSGGYWGAAPDFYIRSKYSGTVWKIITLAEMDASIVDERVKNAAAFILQSSQDKESGGFAYQSGKNGGDHEKIIPCLTGNMVWSLIRFGMLNDPGVQKGIEWIVRYQRFDDGDGPAAAGWPYERFPRCYGAHTCHMGIVKGLRALAEIPPQKRSAAINNTIQKGTEHLLKHHLYKRSHNLYRVAKPDWLKFGFPMMWRTNALEMLDVLLKLDYHDSQMQDAIDLVISKRDETGKWLLETSFNGRMQVRIEKDGAPSKWVTLQALRVLKRWFTTVS